MLSAFSNMFDFYEFRFWNTDNILYLKSYSYIRIKAWITEIDFSSE